MDINGKSRYGLTGRRHGARFATGCAVNWGIGIRGLVGRLSLESCDKDELKIGATKPFVRIGSPTIMSPVSSALSRAEGAEPVSLSIVMAVTPPSIGGNVLGSR